MHTLLHGASRPALRERRPARPGLSVLRLLCLILSLTALTPASYAQSPAPPAAPTGLTIQGAGTGLTLTWAAVPGAATYNLYRSTVSSNVGSTPFRTGLPAGTLTFTDPGLAFATNYYYRLTAVAQGGESAQSAAVSATVLPAPTGATTHPGDAQVTVSWAAVPGATGYKVYRGTAAGGEAASPAGTLSGSYTDFTDSGLTNNQPYYYQVTATTSLSESARSAEVTATPVPPPPAAPASLTLTTGGGQIALAWASSAGATGYNVYRATAAGQEAAPAISSNQAGTTYTDPGLTNGATYFYVVTAVNAGGESAFSPERTAVPNGAPAVPTGLSAVPGSGQVSLSWNTVLGSVTYNVRRAASASGPWGSPVGVSAGTGPSTGYVDTGLTGGTTYYYTVSSVNHVYSTAESAPCAPVSATPGTAPSAPTGLTPTATTTQVVLNWTAPAGTGLTYNVYRSTPSYGQELPAPLASGLTVPTYTDAAVSAGQSYYYKVTALSSARVESARSSEAGAAVLAAPVGLAAQSGNTQVSLSWGLVAGAGSYNLYRGTSPGGEGTTPYQTGLTRGAYEDTGLSNGTTYYYKVTAAASHSESAASNEVQGLPAGPPPLSPPGLSLSVGNGQVALSWTASSGATGYSVYRGTSSGGEGSTALKTGVTGLTWTDAGAANGTTYYYQVTATNASAESARSAELSATPLAPPAAPSYLSATAQGTSQVQLYWGPSQNASGYKVERSPDGSTWTQIATPSGVSYLDTGLSAGTPYWYRVRGTDAGGDGAYSPVASTATLASAPSGLTATAVSGQVSLSWTASAGATSYNVYRGGSAGGESYPALASVASGTVYTDPGLTNGTAYYYTVKAVDAGGESAASNEASATPLAPPGAPTNLVATGGNGSVSLTWTAPSGTVTSYNVKRGTVSGGPYTLISTAGTVTTTGYTDNSAANGITYYYVVSALGAGGESANSGEASATPVSPAPTVATPAAASPSPATGTTTALSVLGADANGESGLTYAWATTGTPPAPVTFSASGTNAAKSAVATFTKAGAYSFQVTITNGAGLSVTSAVSVTVNQTLTTVTVSPATASVIAGQSVTFTAAASDQFGAAIASPPSFTWSVPASGGSIAASGVSNASGQFTAAVSASGPYTVTATSGGVSGSATVTVIAPPGAPTGLSAVGGNASVSLTWTAPSGTVTSYNVKRSTVSGSSYTTISTAGTVTTTGYTDSTAANGTPYYYVVSAVGAGGESINSAQASATPHVPALSAPAGLAVQPGPQQMSVSWTPVSGATSYNLYRGTSSGGEGTTPYKSSLNSTSYYDSPLTSGTYYYQVTAMGPGGESARSAEVSGTTGGTPPSFSGSVKAVAGNQTVTLTWVCTNQPSDGVTGFDIYRGSSFAGVLVASVTGTTWTDTGLTNGTTYGYTVVAVSGAGSYSGAGNQTWATPGSTPLPAPLLAVQPAGATSTTLTWNPVAGATGYDVYRSTSPGGEGAYPITPFPIAGNSYSPPPATACTDTGLTTGQVYYYRVAAVNNFPITNPNCGEGLLSNEASATPNGGAALGVPAVITASAGSAQVTLLWSAVPGATGYNLYRAVNASTSNSPLLLYKMGLSATPSYADTGLTSGTIYCYAVAAVNGNGQGPFPSAGKTPGGASSSSWAYATPNSAPPPAPLLAASTMGPYGMGPSGYWVSWNPMPGITYAPSPPLFVAYNLYRSGTSGGEGTLPVATNFTGSPYSDTTTPPGQTYYYQLTTVTGNGEGPKSAEVSVTGGAAVLPAPTLTATPAIGGVTLTWSAVSGEASYNVYRGSVLIANGVTVQTYTDSGMGPGSYSYQVAAVCAAGQGALSASQTAASSDFSLTATPVSVTVGVGKVGTMDIGITRTGGVTEVDLSLAGSLPAGATATIFPAATLAGSSVDFCVGAGVTPGNYPLTLTGSLPGNPSPLSHPIQVILTVTP